MGIFQDIYHFNHKPKGADYWFSFNRKFDPPVIINNAIEYLIIRFLIDDYRNGGNTLITKEMILSTRLEWDKICEERKNGR